MIFDLKRGRKNASATRSGVLNCFEPSGGKREITDRREGECAALLNCPLWNLWGKKKGARLRAPVRGPGKGK